VGDLAGARDLLDAREADPFDVPDHGDAHAWSLPYGRPRSERLTHGGRPAFQTMMDAVATIPPFETFYGEHAEEVLRLLRRRLGRDRADDAFQETFLRALRAYDRLTHGEHLRAWVLTIATRVAIDAHRRAGEPTEALPELPGADGRPAYEELAFLTDTLPPKERAAVVLRYGYDLDYEQIAAALDSSPDAARQAASSGVRRLRRRIT
jgi:RNA polymerase sigma factor (sigma-70 family)